MSKTITKRIAVIFMTFMIFIGGNIYAASISGNSNVYVGDTFSVTFNFGTNVGAYDNLTVSFDSNVLEYVSGDSLKEDVWWDQSEASLGISTKTYTFRAKNEGSGRIAVVANGVTSANESMDSLGTITAEKLVNVSKKAETPVEKPTTTTPSQGNVNTNSHTASGNNYLKYLQISEEGLTPYFTRNVVDYAITIGENVNSIEILAKAEDENARVEINGNTDLKPGDNTIDIKVTAENGYYRVYTIVATKVKDTNKANAFLENIIIEGYELDKAFQSESLTYNIGEILSTIKSLNVVANAKDKDAKVEILGADKLVESGEGEVVIKVTAPDGTTTKEYKVKYIVKEATQEQIAEKEMEDYLKDIHESKGKKELVMSYLKYIWSAIKKNYLLVIMYVIALVEFINIVVLRVKLNKAQDNNDNDPDNDPKDKTILKVENEKEDEKTQNIETIDTNVKIEPPKVELLDEPVLDEAPKMTRAGSLKAESINPEPNEEAQNSGIKLINLDKNEGPQDEITFNIFENLTDEDIKRMLDEEIDKD